MNRRSFLGLLGAAPLALKVNTPAPVVDALPPPPLTDLARERPHRHVSPATFMLYGASRNVIAARDAQVFSNGEGRYYVDGDRVDFGIVNDDVYGFGVKFGVGMAPTWERVPHAPVVANGGSITLTFSGPCLMFL